MKTYGDKVRLVFRDYPLPMHPNARPAAEAANCAGAQGKFWEYHKKLFDNQSKLAESDLKGYAKDLGLDEAKFAKCLEEKPFTAAIDKDIAAGAEGRRQRHARVLHQRPHALGRAAVREIQRGDRRGASGEGVTINR